ncbi:DUF6065 family protein [Roseomonas populi]|uniref:DUF6065 family protein n=1 Tax=Roseomonas populi TaxID=3121582 RepID=A0ABT1X223_9PROT|nr:DUF6065 family protein [Roseomonas pecuniae]MCR0982137.1 DUF6065 family protein [Roseomonas pecuniae]
MPDDAPPLRLTAHALNASPPRLRAAPTRRDWMDATPQGFANRCLPLTIANAHGWEVVTEGSFEAVWNGGPDPADIAIRTERPGRPTPVSHFGAGVLTFHIDLLFRTDPGISLWVSGPTNLPKDGIAPLTGIVETDWSPATFTMNWRFTRPRHPVRFAAGEPVCLLFPIPRDLIARVVPITRPIAAEPELQEAYGAWSKSRSAFNAGLKEPGSAARAEGWQRGYHRGRIGEAASDDHLTRIRPRDFEPG